MFSMISVPVYDTHGAEECIYIINHGKKINTTCHEILIFDSLPQNLSREGKDRSNKTVSILRTFFFLIFAYARFFFSFKNFGRLFLHLFIYLFVFVMDYLFLVCLYI